MNLIEIGQVVNTHGVRGEIKLNPWTDFLEDLLDVETFYYQEKGQTIPLVVEKIRIHKSNKWNIVIGVINNLQICKNRSDLRSIKTII